MPAGAPIRQQHEKDSRFPFSPLFSFLLAASSTTPSLSNSAPKLPGSSNKPSSFGKKPMRSNNNDKRKTKSANRATARIPPLLPLAKPHGARKPSTCIGKDST